MKNQNNELEQLLSKAENMGWGYEIKRDSAGIYNKWYCSKRNYVKLSKISPAGEAFSMCIDFTEESPVASFLLNLKMYWDSFDTDKHAEMWIPQRGEGGCPRGILDLLTDAEDIKQMIFDLWSALVDEVDGVDKVIGIMSEKFSLLLKEINFILDTAPTEDDCSDEANRIFSDLANLRESLAAVGIV